MKTIKDIDILNKNILIRCDFNVPIENNIITDDSRIAKSIPTIEYCLEYNTRVILMSHLGKVETTDDLANSLKIVADRLGELINQPVYFIKNNENPNLRAYIDTLPTGSVILLENTRFADLDGKRESECDVDLACFWASLGDVFVYDAFGAAHRSHASTGGIIAFLPTVTGLLVEKELLALDILKLPKHPFIGIMGGAKIDDKILLIKRLVTMVDKLLIGGGLAIPFIKAQGKAVKYENQEHIELCQQLLRDYGQKIVLPLDFLVQKNGIIEISNTNNITSDMKIVDIGRTTDTLFKDNLINSAVVFWNGPMGIIEEEASAAGTTNLLRTLSQIKADVIIGGGDTGVLIKEMDLEDSFYHVSTGGGATLNYIEKGTLPVIEMIKAQENRI